MRKKTFTINISKEHKIRILLLTAVFIIALAGFAFFRTRSTVVTPSEVRPASLPTISLTACDSQVNELHGYASDMDACYMRDAIVPVKSDRLLTFTVNTYGSDISSAGYEVRSLDTSRKILDSEIPLEDFSISGDSMTASLTIDSLVDDSEEYILILKLTADGQPLNYYTRICITEDCHEEELLAFARYFHSTSLSENYMELTDYMESVDNGDSSLASVDINSSMEQLSLSGFDGWGATDPVIEFKDISANYTVIEMYYRLYRESSVYNAVEYYRLRYTSDRIYLLDFRRNIEEYFDISTADISDSNIDLGLASDDIHYVSNDLGTIVAFVQAGSLYQYDTVKNRLSCVYTFINDDLTDDRSCYNNHNIKVLGIEESGSMDFVVYGYMNSGDHEGMCGIDIFRYSSSEDMAVEQAFISTTSSYQILNASFNDMLYKTADNKLYVTIQGTLLQIDLETYESTELVSGLTDRQHCESDDGRYFVWIDEFKTGGAMHILDIATGEITDISEDGSAVIPVTFIGTDLVYGYVNEDDVYTDIAGSYVYPMYKLIIADITGGEPEVIKDYEKDGYYITDIDYSDSMLSLYRVRKSGGSFVSADIDTIKDSSVYAEGDVSIKRSSDDVIGVRTYLHLENALNTGDDAPQVSRERASLSSSPVSIAFADSSSADSTEYYVYVGGSVVLATDDLQHAVITADDEMGTVIDNTQTYIWKRGRKAYTTLTGFTAKSSCSSNLAKAIDILLQREGQSVDVSARLGDGTPVSVLAAALPEAKVLDLSGCSLSEALYYVSIGNPVLAITGTDDAVLITGYDAANVLIYHPSTGTVNKMGLNDAAEYFDERGDCFIAYVK